MFKQPTSTSHRVALNTGVLYAKMGITMFISLYTTRLILNSLGASDFGIFGIVGYAIAMLGFLEGAMTSATQRFMSYAEGEGDKEKQKSTFNVSIILHFLIALTVGFVLIIAGQFFFNGTWQLNIPPERMFAARAVYYFMVASTLLTIMTVPYEAVLNAHENMPYYAIVGIFESVLKLAVAFVVVYTAADKLIVYGALMTGISFIVMIIMRIYCHRNYGECVFKPRVYFNKELMREMSKFAGWSFLGNISQTIANVGQGFVINIFFGTIINAAQGIAGQINGQLGNLSGMLMKALNPVIAKSEGAGNRKRMVDATIIGSKMSFCLMAFVSIPVLIEMPYVLNVWLKSNVPEYTVSFCRLQVIRSLIEQLFGTVAGSIVVHGNIRKYEIVASVFCYFPLLASFLLFKAGCPPWSLYAAYVVYTIFASGIITFFAWYNYGFPVSLFLKKNILRCICTFVIAFFAGYAFVLILDEGFFRLLAITGTAIVTFMLAAWFIGLDKDDRSQAVYFLAPVLSRILNKIYTNKN